MFRQLKRLRTQLQLILIPIDIPNRMGPHRFVPFFFGVELVGLEGEGVLTGGGVEVDQEGHVKEDDEGEGKDLSSRGIYVSHS